MGEWGGGNGRVGQEINYNFIFKKQKQINDEAAILGIRHPASTSNPLSEECGTVRTGNIRPAGYHMHPYYIGRYPTGTGSGTNQ
jgi:hypothetical protein